MTVKLVLIAVLLDAQHERDSVENKLASSLVVPSEKAYSGISHLGVVTDGRQLLSELVISL